jgi:hypothetical protein
MIQFAAYIAGSALLLFALIWVFLFPYRTYRVYVLRHYLFAARDKLFAAAAQGELSFDDRAYGMVRTVLNGLLGKADDLSLGNFVLVETIGREEDHRECLDRFDNRFSEARAKLSPAGKRAVDEALAEAHFCVLSHILHISVLAALPTQLFKLGLHLSVALGFIRGRDDWSQQKAGFARHLQTQLDELDRHAFATGEAVQFEDVPLPRAA